MTPILLTAVPLLSVHLLIPVRVEEWRTPFSREVWLRALFKGAISYVLAGQLQAWFLPVFVVLLHILLTGLQRVVRTGSRLLGVLIVELGGAFLLIAFSIFLLRSGAFVAPVWMHMLGRAYPRLIMHLLGILTTIGLGSRVVGAAVEPLQVQLTAQRRALEEAGSPAPDGFVDGGRIIGMLERALLYVLVMLDQTAAVGFLIAAKSVFRIGEISEKGNRMEAEYILIGTLWSFLFALVVASIIRWLLVRWSGG